MWNPRVVYAAIPLGIVYGLMVCDVVYILKFVAVALVVLALNAIVDDGVV